VRRAALGPTDVIVPLFNKGRKDKYEKEWFRNKSYIEVIARQCFAFFINRSVVLVVLVGKQINT
jgi:hypothetical protein